MATPAWPLVLSDRSVPTEGGATTVMLGNIRASIQGQLGLGSAFGDYSLRLKRVDIWTEPDINQPIALRLADLTTGVYSQWTEDLGTSARPAHVHAVWPVSQQQLWLGSANANTKPILQFDHYAKAQVLLHVHCDIMFNAGDPVPTYRQTLRDYDLVLDS
jgi:hypothetical protein